MRSRAVRSSASGVVTDAFLEPREGLATLAAEVPEQFLSLLGGEDPRTDVVNQRPVNSDERIGNDARFNAVLFLASESAAWITGITLDLTGGQVMT